jgi:hypothetical protein
MPEELHAPLLPDRSATDGDKVAVQRSALPTLNVTVPVGLVKPVTVAEIATG